MERFQLFLCGCLFFLGSGIGISPQLHAAIAGRTGVALVHGTNDHRFNAEGGYWKQNFIAKIATSLPSPDLLFVVHCNYGDYMWEESVAGCTVDQLVTFIASQNIDRLIVYTHSNGGNVIRWILSNPTYDSRYHTLFSTISEVIAVAPSSGGTRLADEVLSGGVFEAGVGWLLGYRNNAVHQQRVGDMARFNQEILLGAKGQPSLAVPFRVVVGTNVTASPLSSSSYCNGYLLNTALKLTKIYLDYCSDGFLSCHSQEEAGELWFYDYNQSDDAKSFSHNQSRHDCFGLDRLLITHLAKEGALG